MFDLAHIERRTGQASLKNQGFHRRNATDNVLSLKASAQKVKLVLKILAGSRGNSPSRNPTHSHFAS